MKLPKRMVCWIVGSHRGRWGYVEVGPYPTVAEKCLQHLPVCLRCGRKGATRTFHEWGEWHDPGWFERRTRRCKRCGEIDKETGFVGG